MRPVPGALHPPSTLPCGIYSLGSPSTGAMSLFIPIRNPAGVQKQSFHPAAQSWSPGGTAPDSLNPFFSFSLPPLPIPCQHPLNDSSSTNSRFPPVHPPLGWQNGFCGYSYQPQTPISPTFFSPPSCSQLPPLQLAWDSVYVASSNGVGTGERGTPRFRPLLPCCPSTPLGPTGVLTKALALLLL